MTHTRLPSRRATGIVVGDMPQARSSQEMQLSSILGPTKGSK